MEDSKIDILAINESKLDDTINDDELYLPGFEIVRKDRMLNGRNGGGVCLYLRSNLNYRVREDLIMEKLECLTVEITKPRSRPFLVSTWYRPPNSPPDILNDFENLILLGDFNINMLPGAADGNSSKLRSVCDIYGVKQLIKEPTRVTAQS